MNTHAFVITVLQTQDSKLSSIEPIVCAISIGIIAN